MHIVVLYDSMFRVELLVHKKWEDVVLYRMSVVKSSRVVKGRIVHRSTRRGVVSCQPAASVMRGSFKEFLSDMGAYGGPQECGRNQGDKT